MLPLSGTTMASTALALDTDVSWESPVGRVLSPFPSVYKPAPRSSLSSPRVLQVTRYDPGSAAYRYHSAANTAPNGGVSTFVRYGHENPHCDLRQYDGDEQRIGVLELFFTADVVHVHMDYSTLEDPQFIGRFPRSSQRLVRHYHGSEPNTTDPKAIRLVQRELDDRLNAIHIGARLYHQRLSDRMHWLPIPVPMRDYARLRAEWWRPIEDRPNKLFRIAHSPTNPRIKGTIVLQCVVEELRAKGLPVELVMIAGKSHEEALQIKATCDITFDSFWLGIQGSGLEAACMSQVVVAGDPEVKVEYEKAIGGCPYTYAENYMDLKPVLERLIVDQEFYEAERHKVYKYVKAYHDYISVGARYWQILQLEGVA